MNTRTLNCQLLYQLRMIQMIVMMMKNLTIITVKISISSIKKLIIDNELPETLINSLKYFSIMTRKNVTETAHDEYIKWTNELLCKEDPLDTGHSHSFNTDGIERRGGSDQYLQGLYISLIVEGQGSNPNTLLNAHLSASRLRNLTGISHVRIACCKNSCIAYTGVYFELEICPFCREPRRNKHHIPR